MTMLAAGSSSRDIRRVCHVTLETIRRWRAAMGLPNLRTARGLDGPGRVMVEEMIREGLSAAEIREHSGLCISTIHNWRRNLGLPLPIQRRGRGRYLLRVGVSPLSVARQEGVSLQMVLDWRKSMRRPAPPLAHPTDSDEMAAWQALLGPDNTLSRREAPPHALDGFAEEVAAAWAEGDDAAELAARYGVSMGRLYSYAREHCWSRKRPFRRRH